MSRAHLPSERLAVELERSLFMPSADTAEAGGTPGAKKAKLTKKEKEALEKAKKGAAET